MSPAAYWVSMIVAGVILALCLIVFETTLVWANASAGGFLIIAAFAYRPRAWTADERSDEDEEKELTG